MERVGNYLDPGTRVARVELGRNDSILHEMSVGAGMKKGKRKTERQMSKRN